MNLTFAILLRIIKNQAIYFYTRILLTESKYPLQGLSPGDNVTVYIYDYNGKVKELLK